MGGPDLEDQIPPIPEKLLSEEIHVLDRPAQGNEKVGALRSPPHDPCSVAPKEQLAYPRIAGRDYINSTVPSATFAWWLKEENVLPGRHLHPLRHAIQIFTDTSNEGWTTVMSLHRKRCFFHTREQAAHKSPEIKGNLVGPE